jgi:large subunit ribosomal protein L8e
MSKVIRKIRHEKMDERDPLKKIILSYPFIQEVTEGKVTEILHERGRCAPLAVIQFGEVQAVIAATEGLYTGKNVFIGDNAPVELGNITKIKNVPEGMAVNAVEYTYGDGGKVALANGNCALVINHRKETNETDIKLPSGLRKLVSSECRCVVGVVAGGGVKEKPLLKASVAHFKAKARGHVWPKVRGVAMNPVDHKHGGGNHQHVGKPTTVSKRDSYAQQVGLIGARRSGRGGRTRKVAH